MTAIKSPWGSVAFKAGETEDVGTSYEYIQFTGISEVVIEKVYGVEFVNKDTGAVTTNVVFRLVKDNDKMITCKELFTYTAKEDDKSKNVKKGDTIPSKGYNLVAAIVGMVSGKDTASASWTKCVVKEFGKDINARELKSLAGKKIMVKTQIERTIYAKKDGSENANEDTTLTRVFSEDGYSLAEYTEALAAVKLDDNLTIKTAGTAKAIVIEGKRPAKPKYKKCDKEEWEDLREIAGNTDDSDTDTNDNDDIDDIPDVDADLPSLNEATVIKEVANTPDADLPEVPVLDISADDDNDELPSVDDVEDIEL